MNINEFYKKEISDCLQMYNNVDKIFSELDKIKERYKAANKEDLFLSNISEYLNPYKRFTPAWERFKSLSWNEQAEHFNYISLRVCADGYWFYSNEAIDFFRMTWGARYNYLNKYYREKITNNDIFRDFYRDRILSFEGFDYWISKNESTEKEEVIKTISQKKYDDFSSKYINLDRSDKLMYFNNQYEEIDKVEEEINKINNRLMTFGHGIVSGFEDKIKDKNLNVDVKTEVSTYFSMKRVFLEILFTIGKNTFSIFPMAWDEKDWIENKISLEKQSSQHNLTKEYEKLDIKLKPIYQAIGI